MKFPTTPRRKKFSNLTCPYYLLMPLPIPHSSIYVQAIAFSSDGSWLKLWDMALERGVFGITCIQAILRFLSLHSHSDGTCPAPITFHIGHHVHTFSRPTLISLVNFIDACITFSDSLYCCFLNHYGITNFISSCKIRAMIFDFDSW